MINEVGVVADKLGSVAIIITLIFAVVFLVFLFVFYKIWKGMD